MSNNGSGDVESSSSSTPSGSAACSFDSSPDSSRTSYSGIICDDDEKLAKHFDISKESEEVYILGRNEAIETALETYSTEFSLMPCNMKERTNHNVVFVSGAAGIGKSLFCKNLPMLMRHFKTSNVEQQQFQQSIQNCIEIHIECNGAGDGYSYKIDPLLTPQQRMRVRLLARAARFHKGLFGLLQVLNENQMSNFCNMLKDNKRTHMSNVLTTLLLRKDGIHIPNHETIVEALVKDHREEHKLTCDTIVPIYISVDEHQQMYDHFLLECNESTENAMLKHKTFLYDLMTIQGNGTNSWCLQKKVRIMPLFAGTNHDCLKLLVVPTEFSRCHIPLRGLHVDECEELARNISMSLPNPINPCWFYKKEDCELSHIGYIAAETMGNPRMFKKFLLDPALRQSDCEQIIDKVVSEIRGNVSVPEVKKGVDPAYHAICTGIPLTTTEIELIKQHKLHAYSIIVYPYPTNNQKVVDKFIVQMPPLMLSMVQFGVPFNTKKLLQDSYSSEYFEMAIAERIEMAINLRLFLYRACDDPCIVTRHDLFGRQCKVIWSRQNSSDYQISHDLPSIKICKTDGFWKADSIKPITYSRNRGNITRLNRLVSGEYDSAGPLMHIGDNNHSLFDAILWLKQQQHLCWIQMKGSRSGKKPLSQQVKDNVLTAELFKKYVKRIQDLVRAGNSNTATVTHSIVLVVARKLTESEENTFRTTVTNILAEHNAKTDACKFGDVIIVDDLCDFIPPIAHKIKFSRPANDLPTLTPQEHILMTNKADENILSRTKDSTPSLRRPFVGNDKMMKSNKHSNSHLSRRKRIPPLRSHPKLKFSKPI